MEIILIIMAVFILYKRTWNYHYLIDDIVRRWDYLYVVPETSPPPEFYSSRPHPWRHFFLVITHSLNIFLTYILFGWKTAALFAFMPLSVPPTAWITGGYYSVTAFFALASFFFLQHYPNPAGAVLASLFFTASLGSTITAIGFPFIFFIFNHWGLFLFWPVFMYLTGKRFRTGYKIRDMGKQDAFSLRKIPVMVKVTAYYIHMAVFPYRLAFFRKFGEDYIRDEEVRKKMNSLDKWFWVSVLGIGLFIFLGWQFSPLGVVWFLFCIIPFSQFKVLGQFVAERYIYLPLIGWCLILANAFADYPVLLAGVLILYILRSHFYIPAYEKIESLYEDGIRNFPGCLANYANLGERYIHVGRFPEAYAVLKKGMELDPFNFLCHTNIAAYWVNMRDISKGLFFTEESIRLGRIKSSWHIVQAMRQQKNSLLAFEKNFNKTIWKDREPQFPLKLMSDGGAIRWVGSG